MCNVSSPDNTVGSQRISPYIFVVIPLQNIFKIIPYSIWYHMIASLYIFTDLIDICHKQMVDIW